MTPAGLSMFEALRDGLIDFRGKVEGEPGKKLISLGYAEGAIPDLIRTVLSAVADALAWLGGALGQVESTLRIADSAVALVELADELLKVSTAGFSFGNLSASLGLDPQPFKAVEQGMAAVREAMEKGQHAVGLMPQAEHVAEVRAELERLLGRRLNPALPDAGALGKLLSRIQKSNTP